ncbi:hypothetical protein BVG19_g1708 [[Candida] boidinii]|nr:hypothetical protein BVG19_g1708 [[Candida] boidinii]OWB52369.1 hypothetical protein B5S27_g3944 [[Candida] boidinii]
MARDSEYSYEHMTNPNHILFMETWQQDILPFDDVDIPATNIYKSDNLIEQFLQTTKDSDPDASIIAGNNAAASATNKLNKKAKKSHWAHLGINELLLNDENIRDTTILKHPQRRERVDVNWGNDRHRFSSSSSSYKNSSTFDPRRVLSSQNSSSDEEDIAEMRAGDILTGSYNDYEANFDDADFRDATERSGSTGGAGNNSIRRSSNNNNSSFLDDQFGRRTSVNQQQGSRWPSTSTEIDQRDQYTTPTVNNRVVLNSAFERRTSSSYRTPQTRIIR